MWGTTVRDVGEYFPGDTRISTTSRLAGPSEVFHRASLVVPFPASGPALRVRVLGLGAIICAIFGRDRIVNAVMDCKTCDELLGDYKRSVHLFTKAVLNIAGVRGIDSRLAFEPDRLRLKFKDARDALIAHQHHHHSNLAKKTAS